MELRPIAALSKPNLKDTHARPATTIIIDPVLRNEGYYLLFCSECDKPTLFKPIDRPYGALRTQNGNLRTPSPHRRFHYVYECLECGSKKEWCSKSGNEP